jgi:hypothetical protein
VWFENRRDGQINDFLELLISKCRKTPCTSTQRRNRVLILVTAAMSPRPTLVHATALNDAVEEKSTPETQTTACLATCWLARS